MEIIYKKDDVVEFKDLKVGDVFVPYSDDMRTTSLNDLYLKVEEVDNINEVGDAFNLNTCALDSFWSSTKVIKKDVVLTVM